jgi:PAS domain S-box-containing protein
MRSADWSATPLGAPAAWPAALKTLVDLMLNSQQPMFLAWGADRTWLYNDAFIPIAGRKHPAALGRASRDVWAEAWADIEPLFDQVFAGRPVHKTGFTLGLDRLGTVDEAYFDFSNTPVRGDGAAVQGLFGVCVETTELVLGERRRAEAARLDRDRIFEMSRDLFAVALFDGYLKSINPAWSRHLGRPDEELLARPFADIIHPDDLATTAGVVATLRSGRAVHQFHVRLLRADGTAIPFAWSAVPETGSRSGSFYTVGRDVTDDERREEALRQGQKMEAVGQLTGGIAHDFNNLLQAAHGSLDLIRRKPDNPGRVARLAENGLKATARGAKLTAQLLAFSRAQKPELRPTALAALITGMADILHSSVGPLIRVTVDAVRQDLGVMADPTQLEMAILNLAINARDAMPEGGELTLSARERTLTDSPDLQPGKYVEIRVSDNGPGMPEAVAARAFEPFFTTKPVGQGTGLGLSQVYGMAGQAGGTARIERRAPRGTSVVLLLPAVEAPASAEAEDDAKVPGAAYEGRTVLVVDDDPEVRGFLSASLEGLGFDVVAAEDTERGLSVLETYDPDLLLLDFAMPGLNGAQMAEAVRARRPDLPIIFASGYSETAAIERAVGASAVLLRKPFGVAELEAVLRRALRPRRGQSAPRA